jgi:hypothetical protein
MANNIVAEAVSKLGVPRIAQEECVKDLIFRSPQLEYYNVIE